MIGWLAVAHAAQPAPALVVRSETAAAVRPDALGRPVLSMAERLTVDAPVYEGWRLAADGGVREPTLDPVRADLWQLQLRYASPRRRVVLGRQHRLDPRGFLQLDGASAELDGGGDWGASAWGGRLWDAQLWRIDDVFVGGAGLVHRPSRGVRLDAGAEVRTQPGGIEPRVFAAASADRVRGDRISAVIETSDEALNARVDGRVVASRRWDLGGGVRWEGLAPNRGPRTPYELLAPSGYAIGEGRAVWRLGRLVVTGAAGPTLTAAAVGAAARTSAGLISGGVGASLFGRAASIGGSSLAGGGVELRPVPTWVLDAACYGLQGLDGDAGLAWEARARGTTRGTGLGVAVDAAVFGNDTLNPGVRAGLALRAGTAPVPGIGGRP